MGLISHRASDIYTNLILNHVHAGGMCKSQTMSSYKSVSLLYVTQLQFIPWKIFAKSLTYCLSCFPIILYFALSGQTSTVWILRVLFIKLYKIIRHSVITSALSLFHVEKRCVVQVVKMMKAFNITNAQERSEPRLMFVSCFIRSGL